MEATTNAVARWLRSARAAQASRTYRGGWLSLSMLALALGLNALGAPRVLADARSDELRSGGAVVAGFTLTTGAMVALAAVPIVRCDQDLACLGTAILSIGTFVLAHPFVASAGVHWLTTAAGDRQPYWHSLVAQAAGDALAVSAFVFAVQLAPKRPNALQERRMRALAFTTSALLSLAGPLILRPILDPGESGRTPNMAQLALSF